MNPNYRREELPDLEFEPIHAEGLSDEHVIQITHEVMKTAGIKPSDISPVDSREEALHVLASIAMVARNNPLIGVVEALGEVPSAEELAALASA
jgi:hypothetical protein